MGNFRHCGGIKGKVREIQHCADKFYSMYSVWLCGFGRLVSSTGGTSLVYLDYFSALFEGGEWAFEASPAHKCKRRLIRVWLNIAWHVCVFLVVENSVNCDELGTWAEGRKQRKEAWKWRLRSNRRFLDFPRASWRLSKGVGRIWGFKIAPEFSPASLNPANHFMHGWMLTPADALKLLLRDKENCERDEQNVINNKSREKRNTTYVQCIQVFLWLVIVWCFSALSVRSRSYALSLSPFSCERGFYSQWPRILPLVINMRAAVPIGRLRLALLHLSNVPVGMSVCWTCISCFAIRCGWKKEVGVRTRDDSNLGAAALLGDFCAKLWKGKLDRHSRWDRR